MFFHVQSINLFLGILFQKEDGGDQSREEIFIYTYTDKDFYCVPQSSTQGIHSSSSSQSTHLAEIVSCLAMHNQHSKGTFHKDSANVHDRLSREDPFQMMYIFAAVEHNDEKYVKRTNCVYSLLYALGKIH